MTEPDVVLTDYLLTLESAALAVVLMSRPSERPGLRLSFIVFFIATAVASLLGGTVHGFFLSGSSILGKALWRATLVSIGMTAAAAWVIGAHVMLGKPPSSLVEGVIGAELAAYTLVVLFVSDAFWVAIVNYLPSVLFLATALGLLYRVDPSLAVGLGLVGLALTFAAALIQQTGIALHPVYFNHNALYHALQAIALLLIFWTARYLVLLSAG
jgi:Family of unknown function (DUF6962)